MGITQQYTYKSITNDRWRKSDKTLSFTSVNEQNIFGIIWGIKGCTLFQWIVDVLEHYSPYMQKAFQGKWREENKGETQTCLLPIPYATDNWKW